MCTEEITVISQPAVQHYKPQAEYHEIKIAPFTKWHKRTLVMA